MAKKQKTSTKRKKSGKKRTSQKAPEPISFIGLIKLIARNQHFRHFLGLFFIFFSLLLFVAFVSYLFTWKADQSILDLPLSELRTNPDIEVQNWAGKIGASLANTFINNWFGIASFAFVFLFLVMGFRLLNVKICHLGKTLRFTIIFVIWTSITLAWLFNQPYDFLGGAHGHYINQWLNTIIGKTGTALLLIIILVSFIFFTIKHPLERLKKMVHSFSSINTAIIPDAFSNIRTFFRLDDILSDKEQPSEASRTSEEEPRPEEVTQKESFVLHDNGHTEKDKSPKEKSEVTGEKESSDTESKLDFKTVNTLEQETEQQSNSESEKTDNQEESTDLSMSVSTSHDIQTDQVTESYDPKLELSRYKPPPIDLLEEHKIEGNHVSNEELLSNKNKIVNTLKNYKIEINEITATIGPTITLYEIVPAPGVRISKIRNLEDDIALSLAAYGIRIIAPMPGRGTIGIEVPNQKPEIVSMRSVISSAKFQETKYALPIALGKTISNETYIVDLNKMPHLLIAGATGQGKSVGINAVISSLIYKKHPTEIKFVFVDPKKIELNIYEKIKNHFLAKLPDTEEAIITNNQDVIHTLSSLNKEMDERYELLKQAHARNLQEYNKKFVSRNLNPKKGHRYLPYIVLIIDEFADLIMTAGKEVEMPIARLAQLARAVGIHLIVATQRPSTNIITGVIKANFPTRIAFKVASMVDSRTILDMPGANRLIGRGDMLIAQNSEVTRLQCPFIDTPEVENIADFIGEQPGFATPHILPEYETGEETDNSSAPEQRDNLFEEAARLVVTHQQGSTSLIQRKLSIGYNRAGRIVDQLESAGIIGPSEGSKARRVLYSDELGLEQYLDSLR